jgi:hypothetical protein
MNDALAVAARTLAIDPSLTEDGTFLPADGGPVACRLRLTRPDPIIHVGMTGARSPGYRILLFTAGLPAIPTNDDRVVGRGTTYRILDVEREAQGYWVTLDAIPG